MSRIATDWVWRQEIKPATLKLILLAVADRADEQHRCFPSIERLVADTGLNRKTVLTGLNSLTESGLIIDTGERRGKTGRVKVYQMTIGNETVPKAEPLNSTEIGMVPKTESSRKRNHPEIGRETVPKAEPLNSTEIGMVPKTESSRKRNHPEIGRETVPKAEPLNSTEIGMVPKTESSRKRNHPEIGRETVPKSGRLNSTEIGTQNHPYINHPYNHTPLPPTGVSPHGGNDAKSTRGKKAHSSAIHPRAAPQPKGAHPLPRDWLPSPQLVDWAREKQLALDLAYHTEAFCDYWWGCGKKKSDWDATWRNWMRRENEKSGGRNEIDQGYRRNPTPVERVRAANARREQEKAAANRTIEGTIS